MIQSALQRLNDYIFRHNDYFAAGFPGAYLWPEAGILHGQQVIFPADTYGDMFYLRQDGAGVLDTGPVYQISDCVQGAGGRIAVALVAVVRDADPDRLVQNLINTLQHYGCDPSANGDRIQLQSFESNPYNVIIRELGRSEKEAIAATNAAADGLAIVSVGFLLTVPVPVVHPTCIQNPCPC